MQPQSKTNESPLVKDIDDLKMGFNSLNEELRLLKSQLSTLEEAVFSIKSSVNFLQHLLEMETISMKTYSRVVSKVESQIAYRRKDRDG